MKTYYKVAGFCTVASFGMFLASADLYTAITMLTVATASYVAWRLGHVLA